MLFMSTQNILYVIYRTTQSYGEGLDIFTQLFNTYPILTDTASRSSAHLLLFPSLVHVSRGVAHAHHDSP
jgi:hypothetical protein